MNLQQRLKLRDETKRMMMLMDIDFLIDEHNTLMKEWETQPPRESFDQMMAYLAHVTYCIECLDNAFEKMDSYC